MAKIGAALAGLSRQRLLDAAKELGMGGLSAKNKDELIEVLADPAQVKPLDFLALMSRDELKAMCREVGLDDGGREKAALVARLCDAGFQPASRRRPEARTTSRQDACTTKDANGNGRVKDYRHQDASRKNNPEVGLSNWEKSDKAPPKVKYQYDPHLDPQLIWSGKAEHTSFDVDTVSLHIHERVSSQAIIKAVKRNGAKREQDPEQLEMFADPQLPLSEAVEFYQHDVDWANRLILGDSLLVMNSLLQREQLAGQVQMIYIDPPYGVSYNSNFQPSIKGRDVKDGQDDSLTREPEQIKAYRDTWKLGIHSYLGYLRDRILLSKELLSDSGSIFIQIGDDNVHHVRALLDEVFGVENFVQIIPFRKKLMPLGSSLLESMCDYLLWYAKNKDAVKYKVLFQHSRPKASARWTNVQLPDGTRRKLTGDESLNIEKFPMGSKVYRLVSQRAPSFSPNSVYGFSFRNKVYNPPRGGCWVTTKEKMQRLADCNRLESEGDNLSYVYFHEDFPFSKINNIWQDTSPVQNKMYVVQTTELAIERCLLMTTDPGDLVFDPTCGSGTTAYVAEQWGRRWITCDTSRVALALARQRLLTATYDYYQLRDPGRGVDAGFIYETVPHITLKSIAQNKKIDEVAEDDPKRREKIEKLIQEGADPETLYDRPLADKKKVRVSGPFSVESIPTPSLEDPAQSPIEEYPMLEPDARADDIARRGRGGGHESSNFVLDLIDAMRKAGINKIGGGALRFSKINACQSAGVIQAEATLMGATLTPGPSPNGRGEEGALGRGPYIMDYMLERCRALRKNQTDAEAMLWELLRDRQLLGAKFRRQHSIERNIADFYCHEAKLVIEVDGGIHQRKEREDREREQELRQQGLQVIRFKNDEVMSDPEKVLSKIAEYLPPLPLGEGNGVRVTDAEKLFGISFGPRYGPVTLRQVEQAVQEARGRYDGVLLAGFDFDAEAQEFLKRKGLAVEVLGANINPDVLVGDLLKTSKASQIFTLFGRTDLKLKKLKEGWIVEVKGVDLYNPQTGEVFNDRGDNIAAWFVDSDYDGRCFNICQAFFPGGGKDPWEKLARALRGTVNEEVFGQLRGLVSLPMLPPERKPEDKDLPWKVGVKVIDYRGTEMLEMIEVK
jgi:very-short-patch-repair endonuclease/DNA modification methylase